MRGKLDQPEVLPHLSCLTDKRDSGKRTAREGGFTGARWTRYQKPRALGLPIPPALRTVDQALVSEDLSFMKTLGQSSQEVLQICLWYSVSMLRFRDNRVHNNSTGRRSYGSHISKPGPSEPVSLNTPSPPWGLECSGWWT